MRKITIFDDKGINYNCEYNKVCDVNDINFIKDFFRQKGVITCIPFLETLILTFEYFYPNDKEGVKKLKDIKDNNNIYLVFNHFVDSEDCKEWQVNKFLSKLFGKNIYAENICLFIAEKELKEVNLISEYQYEEFIECIKNILVIIEELLAYDYFETLKFFIGSYNVKNINNRVELKEVKRKYEEGEYVLFQECIFLNEANENPLILRKNGLIMYVDKNNNSEIYFDTVRSNNSDNPYVFIEKIS